MCPQFSRLPIIPPKREGGFFFVFFLAASAFSNHPLLPGPSLFPKAPANPIYRGPTHGLICKRRRLDNHEPTPRNRLCASLT
ncbi:hypothetical protein IWZ03DRAFT_370390 [Phyllosticta citriasiana]|uniref:Secreted protein n=1 Tax=Phyllosticta citriasiana TaxID=595635 RepID=A0ABR1KWZ0_9PEZI